MVKSAITSFLNYKIILASTSFYALTNVAVNYLELAKTNEGKIPSV
jgi:hypothetical protein